MHQHHTTDVKKRHPKTLERIMRMMTINGSGEGVGTAGQFVPGASVKFTQKLVFVSVSCVVNVSVVQELLGGRPMRTIVGSAVP